MRFYFVIILILNFHHCSLSDSKSEKLDKCFQTFLLTTSIENPIYFTPAGYTFRHSCSAESGYSPSCQEYFSRNKLDPNSSCPIGYSKSTLNCSQQNLISVCLETIEINGQSDGLVIVNIFSEPTNTKQEAESFCLASGKKGNYYTSYRTPNETSSFEEEKLKTFIVCLLEQNK